MQIYACQKYAKICNLYASYEDICNRKYMQKYVIENMQKYENICKNMQKNICKNMHINYMQIYVIYMQIYALYDNICMTRYMQKYAKQNM